MYLNVILPLRPFRPWPYLAKTNLHLLIGYLTKILSRTEAADLCARATVSAMAGKLFLVSISSQLETPFIHASASIAFQNLRSVG